LFPESIWPAWKGGSLDAREEESNQKINKNQKTSACKKRRYPRSERKNPNVGIPIPVSLHEAALVSMWAWPS
jgi:hypothetical protein